MSGIEGIGEAVTGGMAARAVEPAHGEAGAHAPNCLNCGTALDGPYCPQCGQKGHVHRTLAGFWHELVHGVFHFEGKIWRTLPMLAWRPGELTRRYVDGERAKFVSPIALFLFSVFLMFAVFSWVGGPFTFTPSEQTSAEIRADTEREFRQEQDQTRRELAQRRAERQRLARARRPTAEVDGRIRGLERELAIREEVYRQTRRLTGAGPVPQAARTEAAQREPAEKSVVLVPNAAPEGTAQEVDFRGVDIQTGVPTLDRGIAKARQNPELLAYKLQSNAYKFSWALIPISVPFVWLLFLHRRRYRAFHAYDHTVFVTYSIAFMSLCLIALSLLRPLGLPEVVQVLVMSFVPPIHMYRQLRGAYGLSRWSAIWRTFALITFAFIAGTLFFLLLLGIGALG